MRTWQMRLNPDDPDDNAVMQWLDRQENMTAAVKQLILADIQRSRGHGVLHQVLAEVQDIKRMLAQGQVSVVPRGEAINGEDPTLAEGIDSLFGE